MYSSISPPLTFTLSSTMALKLPIPFPIFAPHFNPNPAPSHNSSLSELRFSRWNNANAERFEQRRRSQQEIEDQIRRERRFDSATRISNLYDSETETSTSAVNGADTFRSAGTPSSPSNPSIPGRKSKYSKNPNPNSPMAFRRVSRTKRTSNRSNERPVGVKAEVSISEDGVSYVIDGAPFEFKYSYTETPKQKPLKLREPYAPFGPTTMPRPWTGRAPLPPSKKKLPEFDSFQLPPKNKKGIKPVQAPGPFLPGSGPKYVKSREEILGEPLTAEEIKMLVQSCMKSNRQLNIGRDGLTHNMLDNIHSHWKRRRVCKIKCKGVCTVDMDNVKQQLEERTGGKIIYSKGGALYLYRGRNYNYRTRPHFPLMLWKPAAPVYPRLIKQVPDGLTLEEATEMRKKGRKLIPICKLGKNGVYRNLVKHVKEAFEECELVRINCEGLNPSDFKKIGAKLQDLVPCVLISFESEHILMWRGRDWKSSLPSIGSNPEVESAEQLKSISFGSSESDVDSEEDELMEQLRSDSASVVGDFGSKVDIEEAEPMKQRFDSISAFRDSKTKGDIEETESMEQLRSDSVSAVGISRTKMNIKESEAEAESVEESRFGSVSAVGNSETKMNIQEAQAESMEQSIDSVSVVENSETKMNNEESEAEADSMQQSKFGFVSAVGNSETKMNIQEAEAESRFESISAVRNSKTKVHIEEAESESNDHSRFDFVSASGISETKVNDSGAESMKQVRSNSMSVVDNSETEASSIQSKLFHASEASESPKKQKTSGVDGVLVLLNQAIENGCAVVLDESSLDADIVYQRTVAFSQNAPPGPVFRHQLKKLKRVLVGKTEEPKTMELEVEEVAVVSVKEESKNKKGSKPKKKRNFGGYDFSAPQGSLGVDELAKLLA